jgi:hypothetical protein
MAPSLNPLDIMPKWAWLFAALLMAGVGTLALLAVMDLWAHTCFDNFAVCANNSP